MADMTAAPPKAGDRSSAPSRIFIREDTYTKLFGVDQSGDVPTLAELFIKESLMQSYRALWEDTFVSVNGDIQMRSTAVQSLYVDHTSSMMAGEMVPLVVREVGIAGCLGAVQINLMYAGSMRGPSDSLKEMSAYELGVKFGIRYHGHSAAGGSSAIVRALAQSLAESLHNTVEGTDMHCITDALASNLLTIVANNDLLAAGQEGVVMTAEPVALTVIEASEYLNSVTENFASICGGDRFVIELNRADAPAAELITFLLTARPTQMSMGAGHNYQGSRCGLNHWNTSLKTVIVSGVMLDSTVLNSGTALFNRPGNAWWGLAAGSAFPNDHPLPAYTADEIEFALRVIARTGILAEEFASSIELMANSITATYSCQVVQGTGTTRGHRNPLNICGAVVRPRGNLTRSLFRAARVTVVEPRLLKMLSDFGGGQGRFTSTWLRLGEGLAFLTEMSLRELGLPPETLCPRAAVVYGPLAGAPVASPAELHNCWEAFCAPNGEHPETRSPMFDMMTGMGKTLYAARPCVATLLLGVGSEDAAAGVSILDGTFSIAQALSTVQPFAVCPQALSVNATRLAGSEFEMQDIGGDLQESHFVISASAAVGTISNGKSQSGCAAGGFEQTEVYGGSNMAGHSAFLARVHGGAAGDMLVQGQVVQSSICLSQVVQTHAVYMGRTANARNQPAVASRGWLYGGRLLLDADQSRGMDFQSRYINNTALQINAVLRQHRHAGVGLRYLRWSYADSEVRRGEHVQRQIKRPRLNALGK